MANSEEAVWSGSALLAYAILSDTIGYEILGHLPYMPFSNGIAHL